MNIPVIACAAIFGTLFFVLLYRYVIQGVRLYQSSFVTSVGGDLQKSHIFADAERLFILNILLAIVLSLVGFFIMRWVGIVLALIISYILPKVLLYVIKLKRADKFIYQLPDGLKALSASLKAGSNLTKGMEQLATQQPAPLSQEFTIVVSETRMGRDLAESLDDMYERIQRPELELMNSAINISRSVGGNLAVTLDILAETLREKAQVEGKIKALTAMGRMQGWVVALLPVAIGFVLYQQMPNEMMMLFTEPVGWAVLVVVTIMMGIAGWMIRKIVNIDV